MTTPQIDSPPAEGTYGRVLRRTDRDVRWARQQRYTSYDVSIKGRAIEHPDGIVAITLFFPVGKEIAAQRACMIGWSDVTDEWRAGLPLTAELLRGMEWTDLRTAAARFGVYAGGKRPDIEARIIEKLEDAE